MGTTRYMFDYLAGDLDGVSVDRLMRPLEEIATGTSSFGRFDEWDAWYHYLLGRLIPRSHESWVEYLLEYLITGFITQYPHGIEREPYSGFRGDALSTLGKCIMDRACWNNSEINVGTILHRSNNNPNRVWRWWDASGDFSSSLFFCLKYLPATAIADWLRSALAIASPHWRAQFIVWLVGAHKTLTGEIRWPCEWGVHDKPSVYWAWSHCLKPGLEGDLPGEAVIASHLIPEGNREAALQTLREGLTPRVVEEWLSSIARHDYLVSELADIPSKFVHLYGGATR